MKKRDEKKRAEITRTSGKEWFKLLILVAVMFIASSYLFYLAISLSQGEKQQIERNTGAEIIMPIEGKKAEDLDKPQQLFAEDATMLEGINDDEYLRTKAFYYLIHQVSSLKQQEVVAKVDKEIGWKNFLKPQDRDRIRGKYLRIRGELVVMSKEYLADNTAKSRGMENLPIWRGVIFSSDGRLYLFAITDFPEGIRKGDSVELCGAFFKVLVYDTRDGGKAHNPFLIGKTLRVLPYVPPEGPRWLTIIFLGVFAFACILLGIAIFSERKEARNFWKAHRERQQQRKKRQLQKNIEESED